MTSRCFQRRNARHWSGTGHFARNLHIETRVVHGEDPAKGMVDFARLHQITHIFMARPVDRTRLRLGRNVIQEVVRRAGDMQLTVVAQRGR